MAQFDQTDILVVVKLYDLNFPADNYMLKVNNRNTRTRCEKTLESGAVLMSLLLTLKIFLIFF